MAGQHCPGGGHPPPERTGAADREAAVFSDEDPDGGEPGDRHLPGPGVPTGKGGPGTAEKVYLA